MWSCLHIYICTIFSLVVVHSLPLNFFQSIPCIYTSLKKLYFFVLFRQIIFHYFFLCSLNYLSSTFLLSIWSFLSVSSCLFINLYILIKSLLYLISSNVIGCISFDFSSYVRFSKSGTIFVAIICILSNFVTFFFL